MISTAQDNCELAIGAVFAAAQYDLTVLEEAIEDESGNQTRFVVFSKNPSKKPSEKSLPFIIAGLQPATDRPGLLYEILSIFKQYDVNLSQIESRPNRTTLGSYVFYVRLDLNGNDSRFDDITSAMKTINVTIRKMSA